MPCGLAGKTRICVFDLSYSSYSIISFGNTAFFYIFSFLSFLFHIFPLWIYFSFVTNSANSDRQGVARITQ